MKEPILVILSLMWYCITGCGVEIVPKPYCIWYTPDSILEHKEHYEIGRVGDRMRYSTCSSVAWLDEYTLVILNLYGQHIQVCTFDSQDQKLVVRDKITNQHGILLSHPEHLSISVDRNLMLVGNARSGYMRLYTIRDTIIDPLPILSTTYRDLVHNVRFSPDSRFCACVTFDQRYVICIYKIVRTSLGEPSQLHLTFKGNGHPILNAKVIKFSQDGHYVIVAYTRSLPSSVGFPAESLLEVYRFDQIRGTLTDKVCSVSGAFMIEDLALSADQSALIASDQAHDALIVYAFDPVTGVIGQEPTILDNPAMGLSFPHGLSLSPDGRYLAVSNYGDDSVKIFKVYTN